MIPLSSQSAAASSGHPLWLVGFRPFFALACLCGLLLPVLWVAILTGIIPAPLSAVPVMQWHAHEMFFGFGWAVLGGFLLTATKNWMQVRGYHGRALMLLVAAWVLERLCLAFGAVLPFWLFIVGANLFLPSIAVMIAWTLLRHRKSTGFDDNNFLIVVLPLFVVAKNLLLSPEYFEMGVTMTTALFRVAFLVMLERTVSGFMQHAFQLRVYGNFKLDVSIKGLAVLLVAAPWMPLSMAAALAVLLAVLLLTRFFLWHPRQALSRLDIGIMYLGYLAIVAQLLLDAPARLMGLAWVGSLAVHVFTFGPMGLIIPAMIVRISKGHTGRTVIFDRFDKLALQFMIFGLLLRVLAPQFWPAAYTTWLGMAALCWTACYGLLVWRYLPFYFQPRVDGREH